MKNGLICAGCDCSLALYSCSGRAHRLRSKRPTNVALDAPPTPTLLNETQEGPDQPEAIVDRAADMVLVEQALLQLPCTCAAATLRFIEGRSHPRSRRFFNH